MNSRLLFYLTLLFRIINNIFYNFSLAKIDQSLLLFSYFILLLFFFFQDISRNLKNHLALKIYLALRKSHLQRICNVFNVKTGNSNSFEQRLRVKIIINGYYFLKNLQQCALPQECASYDIFNSKKIRLILDTSTRYYYLSKNIN